MNRSMGSWETSLLRWAAAGVLLSLVLTTLGCGGTASTSSAGTVPATSTAPAQPTVSLSATPSTIAAGQTATLSWQTQNASTVTLNGATVSSTGTQTVTPAQTTTYTLVAAGTAGTQQATTTVTVAPLLTVTFTATPNSIQQGQSSMLAWQTTNATAVTLDGTAVAASGTLTVSPAKTAYYDLVATGAGGTQKVTVGVTVIGSASAHVAIFVMENRAYSTVIGNTSAAPYMNSLANTYALATNYYANSLGSSLPDYFMLTVGDTVTTTASYTGTVTEDNVVRELNKAGKTWKAYAEDLPSAGFISMSNAGTDSAGLPAYVYIHNPFIFLCDVNGKSQSSCPVPYDPAQAMNVVPYTQLATDIASGNLPDYIFIIPNNCHNTHDCSLNTGDSWLAANVPPLLNSSAFQSSGIVIVTFDESETDTTNGGGHIPTIIAGPTVKSGYRSTTFYQHQSALRVMMKALGVFSYPNAAASAPDMDEFFSVPLP